jgi:hypothetical protein
MANNDFDSLETCVARGDGFRIQPDGVSAPEGSFVYCLGCDEPETFGYVDDADFVSVEQAGTYEDAKIVRWRVRWRGAKFYRKIVNVTAVTDQTYSVTINSTQFDYVVDDIANSGLVLGSGAAASILSGEPSPLFPGYTRHHLSGLLGMLTDAESNGIDTLNHMRRVLEVSGAFAAGNNTLWSIEEILSDTEVLATAFADAGSADDANSGSISWSLRRFQGSEESIATGLAASINAGDERVFAEPIGESMLAITSTDPDEDFTLAVSASLTACVPTWTFKAVTVDDDWFEQEITPTKSANRFEGSANVAPGGTQLLVFRLALAFDNAPLAPVPMEIPAVYIDDISFDLSDIPFTPESIAGLQAWYRADSVVTASPVETMQDKSGNGRDATQPTSGDRPELIAIDADFGGEPTIDFDSTNNEHLIADALAFLHDAEDESTTVFVVFADDDTSQTSALAAWTDDTNAFDPFVFIATNGPSAAAVWTAKRDTANLLDGIAGGAPLEGVPRIMVWSLAGAAANMVTDDEGNEIIDLAIDVANPNSNRFAIGGALYNGASGQFLTGRIAEIAIYNSTLGGASSPNVIGLINYARERYGFIGDPLEIAP